LWLTPFSFPKTVKPGFVFTLTTQQNHVSICYNISKYKAHR
jgi:hypothetical protein